MDIKLLYELYLQKRMVSTDSRNIIPGSVFFALKGENFNGNLFAWNAIEKGAIAAVVDEDLPQEDSRLIRVENVLSALQQLASYHRRHSGITILSITGSNGKTTTKELCKAVLSKKFKVHATQGNLNNHIGVPLTLLSMPDDCQIGIIEMGANHPGEIASLCEIAQPDYGLITNIGKAHLEGFGGIQGVAKAKGELFNYLLKHEKVLFLNEGNPYLLPLVPENYGKVVRYNGENGLKITRCVSNPLLNIHISDDRNFSLQIQTNLAGSYNAENVLAACSVGIQFGISPNGIMDAIQEYTPMNNRSQLIKTSRNTIFMDAYNANPSSMSAAIGEFLKFEGQRKLLILGEMREVGDSSLSEHEEIIDQLKKQEVKNVICVGKAFESFALKAGYQYAPTIDELNDFLTKTSLSGYFIFVKGSRSNHLEKVIPLL
jgi:UDP-N-acetylmuramoyl-tripeptide--D-alanyl-D-alanine ligase